MKTFALEVPTMPANTRRVLSAERFAVGEIIEIANGSEYTVCARLPRHNQERHGRTYHAYNIAPVGDFFGS